MPYTKQGTNFLYDDVSGDIIGVKDSDSGEMYFARDPRIGVFVSMQDQTDGSPGTPMEFDTTVISRGITLVGNDTIRVDRKAIYNWQLSVQIQNSDSQAHSFDLWGKRNGTAIPSSNFSYSVPSSHGGSPGRLVPSQNFYLTLEAGDEIQMLWYTDDANVTIQHVDPQTSPDRPETPSIILTVNEVSSLFI
jgi:hypothetical protein